MIKKHYFKNRVGHYNSHQKIIAMIAPGKTILDVGCGCGHLAKELTKKGCVVTGIEINRQAALKAMKFCNQVIVGDVENPLTLRKLNGKKFEIIVFSDVLEHLKDPESVLMNLIKFLEIKGKVIIDVPNAVFLTNRLLYLLGRFDYTDWGIMDRTHLRFFTKKSILNLIKNVGLKLEKFDFVANFTQLPFYMQTLYPVLGKRHWWRRLENKIAAFWPEGLAVQFLLFCQRG